MEIKPIITRFRAYQLKEPGSSFSYFADGNFTLIEAKLTDHSRASVSAEMKDCGKTSIDTLHITSWDKDHCDLDELKYILSDLKPKKIEYPGYDHDSDNAKNCLKEILRYRDARKKAALSMDARRIDPPYISSLNDASDLEYEDIFYHPKGIFPGSNDNSTVKLFRRGMFNVASLGDIEHPNIGSILRRSKTFKREVDVLILAHHGSDNDINSKKFFKLVKPTIAYVRVTMITNTVIPTTT